MALRAICSVRRTCGNTDIKQPMATALLSNTARLSVASDLTGMDAQDCIVSTASSSTVRSVSRQLVQLLTVQTSDTALPHAAVHALPALMGFPSTSNAATTKHAAYFLLNTLMNNNTKSTYILCNCRKCNWQQKKKIILL